MTENTQQHHSQPQLDIQRVYIKDLSLEVPGSPDVFKQEWQPEVAIDLDVAHKQIDEKLYEVALAITVTAKMKDKTVFLVEVQQAGLFYLDGFNDAQKDHLLGSYFPTVLFPYAREVITDVIIRASFPQLVLAPVNFDALYMQRKQAEQEEAEKTKSGETKTH